MNGFDRPVRPTSSNLFQILSVANTVAATLKVNLSPVMSTKTTPAISRMLCDENLSSLACCVSPSVFRAVLINARQLASYVHRFKLRLFKAKLLKTMTMISTAASLQASLPCVILACWSYELYARTASVAHFVTRSPPFIPGPVPGTVATTVWSPSRIMNVYTRFLCAFNARPRLIFTDQH
ncbi:hypothetical protein DFH08DRAFT_1035884 [Mycena albidolilacea]|uniref:Uncharacterized protein n=1 Tax=Mycena albidolilacea TaxID=1033008 RepID=A0AAD6ZEQ1_9AGAR|nr:hypothetical protein DFH08DRAFT_1035884 [Mycena albidolilacea]